MEVFEFTQSFDDRLREYSGIFNESDEKTPLFPISSIWSSYLQKTLQQYSWAGVWCLSLKDSFHYDLHEPLTINVSITGINYESLTANVRIQQVSKVIKKVLGQSIEVPLKDIYVAKEQEHQDIDFCSIAKCLDLLRVFCNYLIWPWDEDSEYNFSSFLPKLENRLKLYFDIVEGNLNPAVRKNLITLISRGKKIYEAIQLFMSESLQKLDSDEDLEVSMDLYNNLGLIQQQLLRWKDEKTRKNLNFLYNLRESQPGRHIILPELCNIETASTLFSLATKLQPHSSHKSTSHCVHTVLSFYESSDTIFISPGVHPMRSERLDLNVTIRGLYEDQRPVIFDEAPYWYFLRTSGDNVVFKSVDIRLRRCQTALLIREGVTELDSVVLKSENETKSIGIVIDYNASLVANRCRFIDFDVAILCLPGSALELTECIFENNETCIEILPEAQLCLIDCDLSQSKDGCLKYIGGADENKLKSLDSLSSIDSFSFRSVRVPDESKAVLFA